MVSTILAAGLHFLLPVSAALGQVRCWGYDGAHQTDVPHSLANVVSLDCGLSHTCAVLGNGTVACWGRDHNSETRVPADLPAMKTVDVASSHSCGLSFAGEIICWGNTAPAFPEDLGPVTHVHLSSNHACATLQDGSVHCVGDGLGVTMLPSGLAGVQATASGWDWSCALHTNGSVACWGRGSNGQTSPPTGVVCDAISAGEAHVLCLEPGGTVVSWGWNAYGQTTVPSGLVGVAMVAAGWHHSCAVKAAGEVVCWGRNEKGECNIPSGLLVQGLSAGFEFTCAWTAAGEARCWGVNLRGVTEPPQLSDAISVSLGGLHSCALTADGQAHCWGDNAQGQLQVENGTYMAVVALQYHSCTLSKSRLVKCVGIPHALLDVPSSLDGHAVQLAGGRGHACALTAAGEAVCWGENYFEQATVPSGLPSLVKVAVGTDNACGITVEKRAVCWGRVSLSPPSDLGNLQAVEVGRTTACALTENHGLRCWGSPEAPEGLGGGLVGLAMWRSHSCVVHEDGTVGCWGENHNSQIDVPSDLSSVVSVAVGWAHSCALLGIITTSTSATTTSTTSRSSSASSTLTSMSTTVSATTSSSTSLSDTATTSTLVSSTSSSSSRSSTATSSTGTHSATTTLPVMSATTTAFEATTRSLTTSSATGTLSRSSSSSVSQMGTLSSTGVSETSVSAAMPTLRGSATMPPVTTLSRVAGTWTATATGITTPSIVASAANSLTSTSTGGETATTTPAPGTILTAVESTVMAGVVESTVMAGVVELAASGSSSLRRDFEGGRLLAVRLEGPSSLRVVDAELGVTIIVPQELLQLAGGQPLALAMTLLDAGSTTDLDTLAEVMGPALALDLATLDGEIVPVQQLATPLVFSWLANYTPGTACAFWDGSGWSGEGVRQVAGEAGGNMTCETVHLTVFAGVWEGFDLTLRCSHISLFSREAVAALLVGDWYAQSGAQLFWAMLALLAVTMVTAAVLDWRRKAWNTWKTEFFLVPLHDCPQPEVLGRQKSAFCGCRCQESTWKSCMDEVVSEWFEYFADLRNLLESVLEGLELGSHGSLKKASRRWTTKALSASSKRLAGASTGLSNQVVTFLLEDKDFAEYIRSRTHSRALAEANSGLPNSQLMSGKPETPKTPPAFRRGGSNCSWQEANTREEAWLGLHEEVSEHLPRHVVRHSWSALPRMVAELFWLHNPISGAFHIDLFSSCKLRALLLIVEVSSTLFVTSLFFSATGTVKGRKRQRHSSCYDSALQSQLDFKVGRVLAVAMGAVVLSWVPTTLLASLHTVGFRKLPFAGCQGWNQQLMTWRMQDRLIYSLGSLYTAFCLSFTALFLANVGDDSHTNFGASCLISFLQDALLLPFALSFCLPMAARLLLSLTSRSPNGADRVALIQDVYKHLYESKNSLPPIVKV